jgi:putative transposase
MSWQQFIWSHLEVLVDFFTTEVWTAGGWMTYYVLSFMRVASETVHAGMATSPDGRWMEQMARNMTMSEIGFLCGCKYR